MSVSWFCEWKGNAGVTQPCSLQKVSSLESLKPHAAELHRLCPLVHSASSTAVHKPPKADRAENPEHLQHLRGTVKSLKGERSWLRAQLMEREWVPACGPREMKDALRPCHVTGGRGRSAP